MLQEGRQSINPQKAGQDCRTTNASCWSALSAVNIQDQMQLAFLARKKALSEDLNSGVFYEGFPFTENNFMLNQGNMTNELSPHLQQERQKILLQRDQRTTDFIPLFHKISYNQLIIQLTETRYWKGSKAQLLRVRCFAPAGHYWQASIKLHLGKSCR